VDNNKQTTSPAPATQPTPASVTTPPPASGGGDSKKMIMMLVIGIVVVILVVGGIYYFLSKKQSAQPVSETTGTNKPAIVQIKDALDQELDSINVQAADSDFNQVDSDLQSL